MIARARDSYHHALVSRLLSTFLWLLKPDTRPLQLATSATTRPRRFNHGRLSLFLDDSKRRRWLAVIALFLTVVIVLAGSNHYRNNYYGELAFPTHDTPSGFSTNLEVKQFTKPPDIKIIGLVFFGRRNRVEMLRCYLERNLVDNGGWLDEVHWVQNTDKNDDLKYLDEILARQPRYKKIDLTGEGVGFIGYGFAWGHLERGNLYVKIDDDVVGIFPPVRNPGRLTLPLGVLC